MNNKLTTNTIKAIALIRTSTVVQEIESQKEQVLQMCYDDGLTIDEVKIIGQKGASAIKVDEAYQRNMDELYETIRNNSEVKCVYAWAIDRIGRRESILHTFREFLVQHKIQLKIKANNLTLLDKDGNEDFGVKLQFSLYATLAAAEMENKKERFKRGKERCKKEGKFIGAKNVCYGYSIDKDRYVVINDEEAEVVRMIYDEYISGKYSMNELTRELYDRGIRRNGKTILFGTVRTILNSYEKYSGTSDDYYYPAIVSKEKAKLVKERLELNITEKSKQSKNNYFASKLIKCQCGNYLMGYAAASYKCSHKTSVKGVLRRRGCSYSNRCIKINVLDGILWRVALDCHYRYLEEMTSKNKDDMKRQISVNEMKVKEYKRQLDGFDDKKKRVAKSFIMGMIDDEEVERMNISLVNEEKHLRSEINRLHDNISRISNMLNTDLDESTNAAFRLFDMIDKSTSTLRDMFDLVHKYIIGGNIGELPEGIPGHEKWHGTEIFIETIYGPRIFAYFGKVRSTWNTFEMVDGEWMEFLYEQIEHPNYTNYGKDPKK